MKAKKIYNAPKCKAIEMNTEALFMQASPNSGSQFKGLNNTEEVEEEFVQPQSSTGFWK